MSVASASRLGVNFYYPDGSLMDSPTLTTDNSLSATKLFLNSSYSPQNLALVSHVSAEQRRRCDEVQRLILDLGVPSDSSLIRDLNHGKIPTHLTAQDVTLNRQLRGQCPYQQAGMCTVPPSPDSLTAPATRVGQVLCIDVNILPEPASPNLTNYSSSTRRVVTSMSSK